MGCASSQPEASKPLRPEASFPQKTQNHGTSYHPPASAPNVQTAFGKEAYQVVGQLGTGRNGTMKLMKNKKTKLLVAAKWVPRTQGGGLSKNTEREIVNHRKLVHPNIIRFHEVLATLPADAVQPDVQPTLHACSGSADGLQESTHGSQPDWPQVFVTEEHLVIVMEYAANGQLFERIDTSGPITEELARRLYRQLLDGMAYSHAQVSLLIARPASAVHDKYLPLISKGHSHHRGGVLLVCDSMPAQGGYGHSGSAMDHAADCHAVRWTPKLASQLDAIQQAWTGSASMQAVIWPLVS